jgi:phage head maturation protease
MPLIFTSAPASGILCDAARRTIAGLAVPWGAYATVSDGRRVAFAPGSIDLNGRAKLVMDHDPTQPVGVLASSSTGSDGLHVVFKVPDGAEGDRALAHASSGLRDGFSIGADVQTATETADGLWVTAAAGRHVALVSEPAFNDARVAAVAASQPTPGGTPTMPDPITAAPPAAPPAATIPPAAPQTPVTGSPAPPAGSVPEGAALTSAGIVAAASGVPASPALVRDPYPYARRCEAGGPSFVRDAYVAMTGERIDGADADRWRRAEAMAGDPAYIEAALAAFGRVDAATGDSTVLPDLVPHRQMPERYVPLRAGKAPLWTALTHYPTPDFRTIDIPRTATETGLSGLPTNETTPIAAGDITTNTDQISIAEVEGAYRFSRKLLLGSNPAIDAIALDAMDRAWLDDVERRAVAFFTSGANSMPVSGTYADGREFILALRSLYAALSAGTVYTATDTIPAAKEYAAAAEADTDTGAPILPFGPRINTPGESAAAYAALVVQGVPLWPGPYMTADKTLVLDQSINSAVAFTTPVMNFRLEWTPATGPTANVKVLQLVKYSGVGFWAQYKGGINLVTNTTPIAAAAGGFITFPAPDDPEPVDPELAEAAPSGRRSK